MDEVIRFFVQGKPVPGGSKRFVGMSGKGKAIIVDDSGKRGKTWRESVRQSAINAMQDRELLTGALMLSITFYMTRPKNHFIANETGKGLKRTAPWYHTKKPDATKLLRAVEDALTGIVYRDDAQIALQHAEKIYGSANGKSGALVAIEQID